MRNVKSVYINDTFVAIPFFDDKMQRKIVADLYNKKSRGYIIRNIEVDDSRHCVVYSIPNKVIN